MKLDLDYSSHVKVALADGADDLTASLSDGRTAACILRNLLPLRFENIEPDKSDKGLFVFKIDGLRWLLRVLTHNGVDFLPSKSRGVGRDVAEDDLENLAEDVDGWLVADVRNVGQGGVVQLRLLFDLDLKEMRRYTPAEMDRIFAAVYSVSA